MFGFLRMDKKKFLRIKQQGQSSHDYFVVSRKTQIQVFPDRDGLLLVTVVGPETELLFDKVTHIEL